MPRLLRTILALVLVLAFPLRAAPCCAAPCCAAAPDVSASAFVLMDADSGRVLLARNETDELPIASTTKIMTALVALEHGSPSELATVRREHLREGSSMYLAEGETLTVEALLYGLMLPSGNDAAECLAGHCAGGTEQFVAWMNETAHALGMEHTAFANPSGLDAAGHYSCALDMARLMARAMREPTFARLASTTTAAAGGRTMTNHNKLLGTLSGCIGGKTGYTGAAGRTLVTCAERGATRLIAVTLRDGNDWADHTALYEYGFSAYRNETALTRGNGYALCAVRGGAAPGVRLAAAESFSYPVAEGESLTLRFDLPDAVYAPVKKGAPLGEAAVLLDGAEVGRIALVAAETVDAAESGRRPAFSDRLRAALSLRGES